MKLCFDVRLLLPQLVLHGIINPEERLALERERIPEDRMRELFVEILPKKEKLAQQRFVSVLRQNGYGAMAHSLESELIQLYSHLRLEDAAPPCEHIPRKKSPLSQFELETEKPSAIHLRDMKLRATTSEIDALPRRKSQQVSVPDADELSEPEKSLGTSFQNRRRKGMVGFFASLFRRGKRPGKTKGAYQEELDALETLGDVPRAKGLLSIEVKPFRSAIDIRASGYYDNHTKPKGLALLISNHEYEPYYENRTGTNIDCNNMCRLLAKLDYTVHWHQDRSAKEMEDDAAKFVDLFKPLEGHESCIVVVLTYSKNGKFVGVDGKELDEKQFFKTITKSDLLKGKPKIFIIQACRVPAVAQKSAKSKQECLSLIRKAEEESQRAFLDKVPVDKDFCILYSTTPGYYGWGRDEASGSFFIEAVCEEISAHAHEPESDLESLCMKVRSNIQEKFRHQLEYIELPSLEMRMEKKFHFFPGVEGAALRAISSQLSSDFVPPPRPPKSLPPLPEREPLAGEISGSSKPLLPSRLVLRSDSSQLSSNTPTGASSNSFWHSKESYEAEARNLGPIPKTKTHLNINIQHVPDSRYFQEGEYYDTFSKEKGLALLINNNNRETSKDHAIRTGSQIDYDNMYALLLALGYEVVRRLDLTAHEMLEEITDFAAQFEKDSTFHSCIVVIMTYSDPGQFIGVDGKYLDQKLFFNAIIQSEALIGIPKIFIIQACRGSKLRPGFNPYESKAEDLLQEIAESEIESKLALVKAFWKIQPIESSDGQSADDTCILHSSCPGYLSWKDQERASWFIQAICEEFAANAHEPWADLLTLCSRVRERVSEAFRQHRNYIQLPHVESTMKKKFRFSPQQRQFESAPNISPTPSLVTFLSQVQVLEFDETLAQKNLDTSRRSSLSNETPLGDRISKVTNLLKPHIDIHSDVKYGPSPAIVQPGRTPSQETDDEQYQNFVHPPCMAIGSHNPPGHTRAMSMEKPPEVKRELKPAPRSQGPYLQSGSGAGNVGPLPKMPTRLPDVKKWSVGSNVENVINGINHYYGYNSNESNAENHSMPQFNIERQLSFKSQKRNNFWKQQTAPALVVVPPMDGPAKAGNRILDAEVKIEEEPQLEYVAVDTSVPSGTPLASARRFPSSVAPSPCPSASPSFSTISDHMSALKVGPPSEPGYVQIDPKVMKAFRLVQEERTVRRDSHSRKVTLERNRNQRPQRPQVPISLDLFSHSKECYDFGRRKATEAFHLVQEERTVRRDSPSRKVTLERNRNQRPEVTNGTSHMVGRKQRNNFGKQQTAPVLVVAPPTNGPVKAGNRFNDILDAEVKIEEEPQLEYVASMSDNFLCSHSALPYEVELKVLDHIPITSGVLSLNIENMTAIPADIDLSAYYDTFSDPKGLALLICNHTYADSRNRSGTYVDLINIHLLLQKLQYKTICEVDRKKSEMQQAIDVFAAEFFHGNYTSCVVVMLANGHPEGFLGVDGEVLEYEYFFETITKSEALRGKPKIFIIQACRGNAIDTEKIELETQELLSLIKKSEKLAKMSFARKIPESDDTFVLYSTTPGYYSWRNEERGSWFLQIVCQEIYENAHKPWADIMTLATRIIKRFSNTLSNKEYIEVPAVKLDMCKKFHFFPGITSLSERQLGT